MPPTQASPRRSEPAQWPLYALATLYALSGFAALCYETVWQRALFTLVGVNVEAVTIVVAVFLLGLGIGAPLGGRIASVIDSPALALAAVEATMAIFGLGLMPLLHATDLWIARTDSTLTVLAGAALLLPPTLLMGATFPLATAFVSAHRQERAGRAVGILYVANTLGSAGACFFIALYAMREFGLTGSARAAAVCNVVAALGCLVLHFRTQRSHAPAVIHQEGLVHLQVPARLAMTLAAIAGFVSISYEILWMRAWNFYLASAPEAFSMLLGAFLLGISAGSAVVARVARRLATLPRERNLAITAWLIMAGTVAGFLCVPTLARFHSANYILIVVAGAALGAVLPLVINAAVGTGSAAAPAVARIYAANIVGSVAGSLLTGYVLLNVFPVREVHLLLALAGLLTATLIGPLRRTAPAAVALAAVLFFSSTPLFSQVWERLMFKADFDTEDTRFVDLVENRFGVVSTDDEKTVYGDGSYDGFLEIDIRNADTPIRPLSLSLFHPNPRRVLIIGVAAGAWVRIVSEHPQLQHLTAVEINPGYLEIMRRYPAIAPMLSNPRVEIVIADARRWLNTHPAERFDVIFADTMQHWRSHASNLLSREFLHLAKQHLAPGGLMYYNTTHSFAAQHTAATEFAHVMRFGPFVALSDSPVDFRPDRWRQTLLEYRIDGRPILDEHADAARIDELIKMVTNRFDAPRYDRWGMETEAHLRARVAKELLITDDNMGSEWRGGQPKL